MKVKRILLGLGGTAFTPVAVQRAIELARRHDAWITGVTVWNETRLRDVGPVPVGGTQAAVALRTHRREVTQQSLRQAIEAFEDACAAANVRYELREESGEPFSLMTDLSRYHDLMIFGLRSVFDCGLGLDPEDTLTRLVRAGVRPLIAVSREYRPIRRVLLAYSGSPESAKTIKRFVQSRLFPDVQLRIATCDASAEAAREKLEPMAGYCRAHGYDPDTQFRTELPKSGILAAADEWDADLIVLGNGARCLWLSKFVSSTTLHVIQNANRPLYLAQ